MKPHSSKRIAVLISIFVLLCSSSEVSAGRNRPKLADTVDLPTSFDLDFQLASKQRAEALSSTHLVSNDAASNVGSAVFNNLVGGSMISSFTLPYRWTFHLDESPGVNAFSRPDGEVVVNSGLSRLIGTNEGLWAAVLSHEIAHVARRHAVRKVLYHEYIQQQIDYWHRRALLGDKSAPWVGLGIRIAGSVAEKKLSRELEHDADVQGMLLMARAGYHPDYVFAMHHLLRMNTGEQSKFQAFFADHPRWETRDQRDDRAYVEAVAEYQRLWPDSATSPGGVPPAVAFVGNVRGTDNKTAGTGDLSLPISCRNVAGPVTLLLHLSKDGHPLQSSNANYRDRAGNFAVLAHASCADDSRSSTVVHIPASLVSDRDHRLKAQVDVFGPGDQLLERTKLIDLHFPKPDKRNSQTQTAVWIESTNGPVRQDLPVSAMASPPAHEIIAVPTSEPKADSIALARTAAPVSHAPQRAPNPALALGLVTANSEEKGADILEVIPDSSAETAGLQVGYVITSIDGKRVRSETDLETALVNRAPGSKVKVGYMFRSNLGWMPGTEKELTLAKKVN